MQSLVFILVRLDQNELALTRLDVLFHVIEKESVKCRKDVELVNMFSVSIAVDQSGLQRRSRRLQLHHELCDFTDAVGVYNVDAIVTQEYGSLHYRGRRLDELNNARSGR